MHSVLLFRDRFDHIIAPYEAEIKVSQKTKQRTKEGANGRDARYGRGRWNVER